MHSLDSSHHYKNINHNVQHRKGAAISSEEERGWSLKRVSAFLWYKITLWYFYIYSLGFQSSHKAIQKRPLWQKLKKSDFIEQGNRLPKLRKGQCMSDINFTVWNIHIYIYSSGSDHRRYSVYISQCTQQFRKGRYDRCRKSTTASSKEKGCRSCGRVSACLI